MGEDRGRPDHNKCYGDLRSGEVSPSGENGNDGLGVERLAPGRLDDGHDFYFRRVRLIAQLAIYALALARFGRRHKCAIGPVHPYYTGELMFIRWHGNSPCAQPWSVSLPCYCWPAATLARRYLAPLIRST
jgi:hypothetical protein